MEITSVLASQSRERGGRGRTTRVEGMGPTAGAHPLHCVWSCLSVRMGGGFRSEATESI